MGALAAAAALGSAPDVQAGVKLAGVRPSAYRLEDDSTPYRYGAQVAQLYRGMDLKKLF